MLLRDDDISIGGLLCHDEDSVIIWHDTIRAGSHDYVLYSRYPYLMTILLLHSSRFHSRRFTWLLQKEREGGAGAGAGAHHAALWITPCMSKLRIALGDMNMAIPAKYLPPILSK